MVSTVLAEFRSEEALVEAARRMQALGYRDVDLYTPFPIHGAERALGLTRSRVPLVCLVGGLAGAIGGYVMQWWMAAVDYPINVGNRAPHAAPAFVPITFELGVLLASISVFVGLLVMFGFPRLHHPAFEVEAFRSASVDGLWLGAEVAAADVEKVSAELRRLGAGRISVVHGESGAEARAS